MNLSRIIGLRRLAVVLAASSLAVFAVACGDDASEPEPTGPVATPSADANGGVPACPPATAAAAKELSGAGATFPNPLYTKWVDEYQKLCGARINYNSVGSGAGITQITNKTVDYGASDGIMT